MYCAGEFFCGMRRRKTHICVANFISSAGRKIVIQHYLFGSGLGITNAYFMPLMYICAWVSVYQLDMLLIVGVMKLLVKTSNKFG